MTECSVRGCTGTADSVFVSDKESSGLSRHQWPVCAFDLRRLELGAAWTSLPELNQIVMNDKDAPLDVLGHAITKTTGSPVIELELGRDDITEQVIQLRITPERLRSICAAVTDGGHPL